MKTLLTYLTIALSLLIGFGINVKASNTSPQITVYITEEGKDIREESPWGYRKPTQPITCMIDFNSLSITCDRIPMVLSYELWNETGESMSISYYNDCDMVRYISSLTGGIYQLRLICTETIYIGYIECIQQRS